MIADFDDFCTWMYVLISDLFAPLASHVARPGSAPTCTEAELITMAIVGECCGWDEETVVRDGNGEDTWIPYWQRTWMGASSY